MCESSGTRGPLGALTRPGEKSVHRGIVPVVVKTADHPPGNYREQMLEALNHAKAMGLVKTGDQVVGLHALGKDSVMKVLEVH